MTKNSIKGKTLRGILCMLLSIAMLVASLPASALAARDTSLVYSPNLSDAARNLEQDPQAIAVASYERTNDNAAGVASAAIDGDPTTRWASSRNGGEYGDMNRAQQEWIYVDLGSEKAVSHVILNWEGAYAATYEIQVSNDDTPQPMTAEQNGNPGNAAPSSPITKEWKTAAEVTAAGAGEAMIPVDANARYIQMRTLTPNTDYGYSLYDFQVVGYEADGEVIAQPTPEPTTEPTTPPVEPTTEPTEPPIDPDDRVLRVNAATGSDANDGVDAPFKTINAAARAAMPGDTVLVAAGTYREHVQPLRGGNSEETRITYQAVGDVVIKGSEQIPTMFDGQEIGWVQDAQPGVWKVNVPNKFFYTPEKGGRGSDSWTNGTSSTVNDNNGVLDYYNPFRQKWYNLPSETSGDVYVDNFAYDEVQSLSDVNKSTRSWFANYDRTNQWTTIYVNFGSLNPNAPVNLVEINTRKQNFAPSVTVGEGWGLQYITVDGFTMMHAGNWYSSFPDQPERAQMGALSVSGGYKWIIQNNRIINAAAVGMDIGLGSDMWAGNGNRGVGQNKPHAEVKTWFTEGAKYGHHLVQNNFIDRSGQCGIAGVFSWNSQILNNHIANTNYQQHPDGGGAETGAIKLHYCNEGLIKGNYIQNMQTSNGGGIWTDWGCQGIRVTGNVVVNSDNPFYAEALHGPVLVDNNVFIGTNMRTLDSSGVVFVNNLLARDNRINFPANQNIAGRNANATGSGINIDGEGRNTYWFEPHTVIPGMGQNQAPYTWFETSHPKQEFFWYNNLTAGNSIPNTNTTGYIKTHNKVNTYTDALTNVNYTATSGAVSVRFNLDQSKITGTHTIATKDGIGEIKYPNPRQPELSYTVGQPIQADVTADFFGKPYPADGTAKIAGPFSDVKNGANEYQVWPIPGAPAIPKPLVITEPDDGGEIVVPRDNLGRYKTYSDNSHEDADPNPNLQLEYHAQRAFDGSGTTRYASKAADGAAVWMQVDLGGLYDIEEIVMNWHPDYAKQYKLQVSEFGTDGTWRDLYVEANGDRATDFIGEGENAEWKESLTAFIGMDAEDEDDNTSKYVRFVRFQGVETTAADKGYSIREMEIYGSVSPVRLPDVWPEDDERRELARASAIPGDGFNPYSKAYASFARDPHGMMNIIDGDGGTRWSNDHGNGENDDWIYVDLGNMMTIDEIQLDWEAAHATQYRIEISSDAGAGNSDLTGNGGDRGSAVWNENIDHATDNMTWTTIFEYDAENAPPFNSGGKQTINLIDLFGEGIDARSVRVVGLQSNMQYGYSLYEVRVYGTKQVYRAPINEALNKPAVSASDSDTNTKDKAFDGDMATRWGSSQDSPQWIYVDLQDIYRLREVTIDWEASFPAEYKIQVATSATAPTDESGWTDVAARTLTAAGQDVVPMDNVLGRYVRMLAPVGVGPEGWGISIYEMQVFGLNLGQDLGPVWAAGTTLKMSDVSNSGLTLTWPEATISKTLPFEVAGYKVMKDGVQIADVKSGLSYAVTGLDLAAADNLLTVVPYNTNGKEGSPIGVYTASYNTSPTVAVSDTYPADYSRWEDSLVAGNGKFGIMVFGNPRQETVVFNDKDFFLAREESSPHRIFQPISVAQVNAIRDNLLANNWNAANPANGGGGANAHNWQGGGEMTKHVGFKMNLNVLNGNGEAQANFRSTDYTNGLVKVNWIDNDGLWERTSFVSREDNVTVQRMDAPAGKTFDVSLGQSLDPAMNLRDYQVSYNNTEDFLNIRVKYPGNRFDAGYEGVTKVLTDGTKTLDAATNTMVVEDATYITLLTQTKRYYGTFDGYSADKARGEKALDFAAVPAEQEWAEEDIQYALDIIDGNYTYEELLERHTKQHSEMYGRVSVDLGASDADRAKTNEVLLKEQQGQIGSIRNVPSNGVSGGTMIPALYERLHNAGRYHLMASGGEFYAPDLLGNWTGQLANWDGSFHLDANLNFQISSANIGNLPEVAEGYFWLNEQWQRDSRYNATTLLGTDGMLTPGNAPNHEGLISSINPDYPYQYVTGGQSWLNYVFWEYYQITGDKEFLRDRYYPMARALADFYDDFLINNVPEESRKDDNGAYILAGSISPETRPNGRRPLSINSVYDVAGAKFAMETLLETIEILDGDLPAEYNNVNKSDLGNITENAFRNVPGALDRWQDIIDELNDAPAGYTDEDIARWTEILENLPAYYTNSDGAIPEFLWGPNNKAGAENIADAVDYGHRHSSWAMPVWPFRDVNKEENEDFYNGTLETLKRKINGGDYHNKGHGLLHGSLTAIGTNQTEHLKANLLRFATGTYYAGLTTAHDANDNYQGPPYGGFCMDTANGMTNVLLEMLANSAPGRLELLPAVSEEFSQGSVKGMLGRSQFAIDDLSWDLDEGEITLTLTSKIDQTLTIIEREGIKTMAVVDGDAKVNYSEYGGYAREVELIADNPVTFEIVLGEAEIVYDYTIQSAEIADGVIESVAITAPEVDEAMVYVVVYNENGSMKDVVIKEIDTIGISKIEIDLAIEDNETAKAMIWSKEMLPLIESYAIQ